MLWPFHHLLSQILFCSQNFTHNPYSTLFPMQDKRTTPPDPRPVPRVPESLATPSLHPPSRLNSQTVCQTPNSYRNPSASRFYLALKNAVIFIFYHDKNWTDPTMTLLSSLSFVTPVIKRGPEVSSSAVAPHRAGPVQQPFTPLNQAPCVRTPQVEHVHDILFTEFWFLVFLFLDWEDINKFLDYNKHLS